MIRTFKAVTAVAILSLLASLAMGQYSESPYDAAKVAAGELPALAERLPDQPSVVSPQEGEIGVYGGQFNVFADAIHPWNDLTEEPARGPFLLNMTLDNTFEPDLALNYSFSDDFTEFTLNLRPGMKWSNGDPFTSEDFRFKREDMRDFDKAWTQEQFGTTTGYPEIVDDYTVVLHLGEPIPATLLNMVHWKGGEWSLFHPSKYLKKWHGDHNENADALAVEEGFINWQEAFGWHSEFNPLNDWQKPTTQYWMPLEFSTTARLYERNPYMAQVDTAGQQLPYVDRVLSQVVDPETAQLKIITGEADLAWGRVSFANYSLYKENEASGNYEVNLLPSFQSGAIVYHPNLDHPDPVKRDLFQNLDFRRALSVALDRQEMNEIVYSGFGVPLQHTVVRTSSFYQPKWGQNAAEFDPDQANALLDGLGLTEKNDAGIRLRPDDGKPLQIIIEMENGAPADQLQIHELTADYWRSVGIDVLIRGLGAGASRPEYETMEWDVWISQQNRGEMYVTLLDDVELQGFRHWGWTQWVRANEEIEQGYKTAADFPDGLPGAEPPPEVFHMYRVYKDLQDTVFGSPEYRLLATEYFGKFNDNLYTIGTVAENPILFIARPDVGNIPTQLPPWLEGALDLNHFSGTWFYRQ